jgi:cobalt-zinc-cadmium efflux system outer membrane protein
MGNSGYAGRVPNIDALASVKYDASTHSTMAGLSIGVPLPVFDRNQGNIRRAQAELIGAEAEVQRLELQLRNRLAAAFQRNACAQGCCASFSGGTGAWR